MLTPWTSLSEALTEFTPKIRFEYSDTELHVITMRSIQIARHFTIIFCEWKSLFCSHMYFAEIYSHGSNEQYARISSDNGLVPNRWRDFNSTNDDLVFCCIYVSISINELYMEVRYVGLHRHHVPGNIVHVVFLSQWVPNDAYRWPGLDGHTFT